MEKIPKDQKFKDNVLWSLHLCGLSPLDHGFLCNFKRLWSILSHTLITIGIFLELITNYRGFETIIRASKILPIQVTLGAKMLFFVVNKNALKNILDKMNFSLANIYINKINRVGQDNMDLVHQIYKIQLINTLVLILAMTLTAAITRYPVALTYNEAEMSNLYWASVLFVQCNYLISQSLSTCGTDGLFAYMVAHVVIEMKMLSIAITEYTFDGRPFGLNVLIEYHNHLLSLAKDIINAFSLMLFFEYIMDMGTLCFNLVLLTSDGIPPDMKHAAEYGVTVLYLFFVLAFFSYAGDVLAEQCENLSNIIFHEMTQDLLHEENRGVAIMMIHRAQKYSPFTLGGFFDLNLINFNVALSNCIRFVMFINTLRDNVKHSQY